LGGIGTGIIYIGVIGLMVKWFPDKRGLATGLVAAGYGMGAVFTTFPISIGIAASGYQHTLIIYGLAFGVVGLAAALALKTPPSGYGAKSNDPPARVQARDVTPAAMLRTPIFWLLFLMMTMMSTSGLMVISQIGAFARDFGVAEVAVFGFSALPLALTLDRITNGLTRPFFGWVSDRIGREYTMLIAFALEGCAMTAWLLTRDNAVLFVLLSGVVFFGWGEIFSLFPSTLTDTFGPRHATTNYGLLYMAQGIGSILGGPLAALLYQATATWTSVFAVVIVMNFATALLALAALRPARQRYLAA
jgi:oxalate/formate antiporter